MNPPIARAEDLRARIHHKLEAFNLLTTLWNMYFSCDEHLRPSARQMHTWLDHYDAETIEQGFKRLAVKLNRLAAVGETMAPLNCIMYATGVMRNHKAAQEAKAVPSE